MNGRGHERFADDVGAYLLGALDDDERAAFEAHLNRCEACRDAVAALEPAVDALPRVVDPVEPPRELKTSLMATVRAEPRHTSEPPERSRSRSRSRGSRWRGLLRARPALAAVAASALVALGVAGGALLGSIGSGDEPRVIAATVDRERQPAARVQLVVPDGGDGAILRASGMEQAPPGRVYEVWVKRGADVQPASLFAVARDGTATAAIPTSVEGVDAVLVTREPDGGSDQPSEPPVVSVDIAG